MNSAGQDSIDLLRRVLTGDIMQWYALETLGECFIIPRSRGSCLSCGHDLKQDGLLMLEILSTDWLGVPMSSKLERQKNSQWEQCKKDNENSLSNSRNQL
ncbi:MAG: hypothetical protein ACLQT6_12430 [Desulfomonilaceae bacterium]